MIKYVELLPYVELFKNLLISMNMQSTDTKNSNQHQKIIFNHSKPFLFAFALWFLAFSAVLIRDKMLNHISGECQALQLRRERKHTFFYFS